MRRGISRASCMSHVPSGPYCADDTLYSIENEVGSRGPPNHSPANGPILSVCDDKPMTSYFAAVVDLVAAPPHYALAAVFLLALSEAIPVVGTVVPGSTLIIGISAVATG